MLLWISWLMEILGGVVVDLMVSGDTWCCGSHG